MKTLFDIYKREGPSVLSVLHEKTGANKKYLYQIAVGIRRPSPALARKLVVADGRLTLEGLLFPDKEDDLNAKSQHSARSPHESNSTPTD